MINAQAIFHPHWWPHLWHSALNSGLWSHRNRIVCLHAHNFVNDVLVLFVYHSEAVWSARVDTSYLFLVDLLCHLFRICFEKRPSFLSRLHYVVESGTRLISLLNFWQQPAILKRLHLEFRGKTSSDQVRDVTTALCTVLLLSAGRRRTRFGDCETVCNRLALTLKQKVVITNMFSFCKRLSLSVLHIVSQVGLIRQPQLKLCCGCYFRRGNRQLRWSTHCILFVKAVILVWAFCLFGCVVARSCWLIDALFLSGWHICVLNSSLALLFLVLRQLSSPFTYFTRVKRVLGKLLLAEGLSYQRCNQFTWLHLIQI